MVALLFSRFVVYVAVSRFSDTDICVSNRHIQIPPHNPATFIDFICIAKPKMLLLPWSMTCRRQKPHNHLNRNNVTTSNRQERRRFYVSTWKPRLAVPPGIRRCAHFVSASFLELTICVVPLFTVMANINTRRFLSTGVQRHYYPSSSAAVSCVRSHKH